MKGQETKNKIIKKHNSSSSFPPRKSRSKIRKQQDSDTSHTPVSRKQFYQSTDADHNSVAKKRDTGLID